MAAGYAISKMLKLNIAQQICIAIEVGIQNGTLALAEPFPWRIAITAGILTDAEMAIPAAIFSQYEYLDRSKCEEVVSLLQYACNLTQ